jgi:hypothetical protein
VNGLFDFAVVAAKSFHISLWIGGRSARKIAGPGINGKVAVSLGARLNFDGVITVNLRLGRSGMRWRTGSEYLGQLRRRPNRSFSEPGKKAIPPVSPERARRLRLACRAPPPAKHQSVGVDMVWESDDGCEEAA